MTFTDGCGEADFRQSDLMCSAVAYQMIVLGATKRLSVETRERNREVRWKNIMGMRDILSHQYDRLDFGEIWRTARGDVPARLAQLRGIHAELDR
jgi:uncharacterized protein with HEPN domain